MDTSTAQRTRLQKNKKFLGRGKGFALPVGTTMPRGRRRREAKRAHPSWLQSLLFPPGPAGASAARDRNEWGQESVCSLEQSQGPVLANRFKSTQLVKQLDEIHERAIQARARSRGEGVLALDADVEEMLEHASRNAILNSQGGGAPPAEVHTNAQAHVPQRSKPMCAQAPVPCVEGEADGDGKNLASRRPGARIREVVVAAWRPTNWLEAWEQLVDSEVELLMHELVDQTACQQETADAAENFEGCRGRRARDSEPCLHEPKWVRARCVVGHRCARCVVGHRELDVRAVSWAIESSERVFASDSIATVHEGSRPTFKQGVAKPRRRPGPKWEDSDMLEAVLNPPSPSRSSRDDMRPLSALSSMLQGWRVSLRQAIEKA